MAIRELYQERRQARAATRAHLEGRDRLLAVLRLVVFAGLGVAVWAAWTGRALWPVPVAVVVLFVVLVIVHDRALKARRRAELAEEFWAAGLRRLDENYAGQGPPGGGARYADAKHPYAGDLDIVGPESLLARIVGPRTAAGQSTLAAWLLRPVSAATARTRQEAVRELAPRAELREALAVGGEIRKHSEASRPSHDEAPLDGERLRAWAAAPAERGLAPAWLPWALGVLGVFACASAAWWQLRDEGRPFLLAGAINLVVLAALRNPVRRVGAAVTRPVEELAMLAEALQVLEREKFSAPHLVELQKRVRVDGRPASAQVRSLAERMSALNWPRNLVFMPIAFLTLWGPQWARVVEGWRRRHGAAVAAWVDVLGELEALAALGGWAAEHPDDVWPEIVDGDTPLFEADELGHPLLPSATCVRNDVAVGTTRLYLVSGSNMSGKSTLLRTVGLGVVLALAGAPLRARRARLTALQIGATLRVSDSLAEGASRFFAEITRLRQLVALAGASPPPLLFLLDEVLSGTNSHDRRQGAEAVVRGLLRRGAAGFCTTHDLALTAMATTLDGARNVHFEDQLVDGKLVFDYRMRDGVVEHSNALALMAAIGLETDAT
jgi:hypothetical protein